MKRRKLNVSAELKAKIKIKRFCPLIFRGENSANYFPWYRFDYHGDLMLMCAKSKPAAALKKK